MRYLLVLSLLPLPLLAFKESTPAPGDFQLTAKPVGKDAAGKGVYYSLPENYYVVALPVLSKTFTPGPFCGLAGEFFSISWLADDFFKKDALDKACKAQETYASYRVKAKDVSLDVLSRPDPAQRFVAAYGGSFNSNQFSFTLGSDGILNKGAQNIQSRKYEFFTSLLQTAASIAGKFFGAGFIGSGASALTALNFSAMSAERMKLVEALMTDPNSKERVKSECSRAPAEFLTQDHLNFRQLPQDYQRIYCHLPPGAREEFMSLTASGALIGAFRSHFQTPIEALKSDEESLRKIPAGDLSRFLAAAQLARELESLREKNSVFMNPQANDKSPLFPADEPAFSALLKSRADRIQAIERLFTGVFETDLERVVQFEVTPKAELTARAAAGWSIEPLAMTSACGKFEPKTPAGSEYPFRWLSGSDAATGTDCKDKMTSTAFSMSLAVTEPVAQPVQPQQPQPTGAKDKDKNKDKKKEEPENGLAYRVPAWGLITIKAAGTIVRTERVPIAQLGATANLQAKIGSGTSCQFTLDPLTGALRDVAGTGQPSFTPERVKMLEGVADSIFGAAGAARKALADPEPDSRLSLLQKQTREVCEEARLVLFEKCKADTKSGSCELALKACP